MPSFIYHTNSFNWILIGILKLKCFKVWFWFILEVSFLWHFIAILFLLLVIVLCKLLIKNGYNWTLFFSFSLSNWGFMCLNRSIYIIIRNYLVIIYYLDQLFLRNWVLLFESVSAFYILLVYFIQTFSIICVYIN